MSVHKFTDGRKGWYFSVRINGKQYKRERYRNKKMTSKKEAQEAEKDFIERMQQPIAADLKLYSLYDEFVKTKSSLKRNTIRNYKSFAKNELLFIPNKPILDLTIHDIQEWKDRILAKAIGIDFKNRKLKIIKALLEYGSIVYNLPSTLQKPLLSPLQDYSVKLISQKEKWLKKGNFEGMLGHLDISKPNEYYYFIILKVLYYTGLRIGELAALTPSDIQDNYIIVNKSYERVNGIDYIASPKSKNSIRKVYISLELQELIQGYIKRMYASGTLFHQVTDYLNQQKVRRVLHRLAKQEGITDIEIKLHNLRHSHAANLKEMGWNEYEIAQRLGNTPKVSSQIYIHADTSKIIEKSMKI